MDRKSNFRRGSVELMVLHLLSLRDYYGYNLPQIIRQETNGIIDIPIGSLYPAQNRTEIYHQLTGFPFDFFAFLLFFYHRKIHPDLTAPCICIRENIQFYIQVMRHFFCKIKSHTGCFLPPVTGISGKAFLEYIRKIAGFNTHTIIPDRQNDLLLISDTGDPEFSILSFAVFDRITDKLSKHKGKATFIGK